MFIDTHAHLQWPDYDADRAMIIGNAKKAGVKQCIVPGVDVFSSTQAIELAKKYPGILFAAIGFHPYEAQKNPDVRVLEGLLPAVAIGEIGLDYHLYKGEEATSKKDHQKNLFHAQLTLALAHDLPVIMHCRDAFEDFFDVLDTLPTLPRGVIHCFSGGLQEFRMAKARNFYIGIDGNATYSKQLAMVLPSVPLAMMLLETDSPFLTPIPHRGERNEPKYIPLIAAQIATWHRIPVKEVERVTTKNAKALFRVE